jgi:uncharacterized membrane protein YdjX (TVP38/TMEM64 family)
VEARSAAIRWTAFGLLLLAFILVPFALFGVRLEEWSVAFLDGSRADAWLTRMLVTGLLAVDIVLPVPSSAVSTFAGASLGFWDGFLTSTAGMSLGCAGGYAVARFVGRTASARLVGENQLRRLEAGFERWGDWMLITTRAVPVLAEASTLVAGVGRTPFARFVVVTTLANAGISAVYSAVGAYAANTSSFLLALSAAVLVPGVMLIISARGAWRSPARPA